MNKFLSLMFVCGALIYAGEIRYGSGTYYLKGGFLGLDSKHSTDISSYSLVQQHKNVLSSKWYYSYNLTWYDSEKLLQAQNSIDTGTSQFIPSNPLGTTTSVISLPAMTYRYQGLDAEASIGYDFVNKSENDFIGIGLLLGISAPWIDSGKDSDSTTDNGDIIADAYEKSKTQIFTYKVGPAILFRKSIGQLFSLYGTGVVAYQNGTLKNDYAGIDTSVNGWYEEFDIGIRFQPLSYEKDIGWFTISPRLYVTLGYRYSFWQLKDIAIDTSGTGVNFESDDLEMTTSLLYFGLGYSF